MSCRGKESTKLVKPGPKTSEFWLTVATQVFGALIAAGGLQYVHPIYGPILMLLSKIGYDVSRGLAKR